MGMISVIVAGGTGSTGREVVSRLVAHPNVGRVVVLSRYPIPVNRWHTFFPNLRTADALKHLSIVAVDWSKLHNDTHTIPVSILRSGGSSSRCNNNAELMQSPKEELGASRSSQQPSYYPRAAHLKAPHAGAKRKDYTSAGANNAATSDSGDFLLSDLEGNPILDMDADAAVESPSESSLSSSSPLQRGADTDTAAVGAAAQSWKRPLDDVLQSAFYRSIFSGHHAAVNCLGSHNVLRPKDVVAVDHDFALAFAKLVRIFNCHFEAEGTEDGGAGVDGEELKALQTVSSLPDDGTAWKELCAAFLGADGLGIGSALNREVALEGLCKITTERRRGGSATASSFPSPLVSSSETGNGGQSAGLASLQTLLQFTQVSTAGASALSPFPYFRAHGLCDEEVLKLFCNACAPPEDSIGGATTYCSRTDSLAMAVNDSGGGSQHHGSATSPFGSNCVQVCIWKPGLLKRHTARWVEKLLAWFAPPVSVDTLSDMVVEELIASVSSAHSADSVARRATVKVINAKHISAKAALHQRRD